MKIQFDQLSAHLTRNLAPVYVITGEEILFLQEAEQNICMAAAAAGFNERIRLTVDTGFDWSFFQQAYRNRSIFSDKKYITLQFPSTKLNEAAKKALSDYFERPRPDNVLVIRTGKLDAATQKTDWYKSAEKIGMVVPVWPLSAAQLPIWLKQRLQSAGFQADTEALQLLTMRTEGNLLAAAQEIEKLTLLFPQGKLTLAHIQESSGNSARYTVFNLMDAILQGNPTTVMHTLHGLKAEAVEPILVLWALAREARQWVQWLQAIEKGQNLSQLLGGNPFMERKKNSITRALQHHSLKGMHACLQHASRIDKAIKGVAIANVWDELGKLALFLTKPPASHAT